MHDGFKFIVAGCPRSATAYMSRLFSNIGLNCGHEKFYKFEQKQRAFLECDDYAGDASWLATPFLKELPPNVRLLHQTRHPVDVIRSLLRLKFFDLREDGQPVRQNIGLSFTQFAFEHCQSLLTYDSAKDRAIWFYYHWNKMVEQNAAGRELFRYSIESLSMDLLSRVLTHVGVPKDWIEEELLEAHLALLPRNINAKTSEKFDDATDVVWDDMPQEVQSLARSYGYEPVSETAERIEAWTGAVRSAQQTLRKQAQLVDKSRQMQTAKLQADLSMLRRRMAEAEHASAALRKNLTEARQARDSAVARYEMTKGDPRETPQARRMRDAWICSAVAGERVLDADCGDARRAVQLVREGFDVTALAPKGASSERKLDSKRAGAVKFVDSSLANFECDQAEFDTVILGELPTRVTQRARLFKQASDRLRSGGIMVACVPLGRHQDGRRLYDAYGWDFLKLVNESFDIIDCEIVEGYMGVAGRRPEKGAEPRPIDSKMMEAWVEAASTSLSEIQRRRELHLQILKTELDHTRDELARAHANNVRLVCTAPGQSQHQIARTGKAAVDSNVQEGGVLFFCTNGAGLGHLTRAMAIARRLRQLDPKLPLYFLSSCPALTLITRENVVAYHIPPQAEFGEKFNYIKWNDLLLDTARLIIATHRPTALIYDGVSPFRGLLNLIDEANFIYSAMVLRLRHKHSRLLTMLKELNVFGEMIFPSEEGAVLPEQFRALRHQISDPIVYLDREELLPREEARRRLQLSPDRKAVFVQLGAGNINDTSSWFSQITTLLRGRDDVDLVAAESPISVEPPRLPPDVRILSHYPNSLYFNAFDMAVSAVGYNTYHELMHFGVPSVLIPNQHTVTDDQVGRARTAENAGAARVVMESADLAEAVEDMLQDGALQRARRAALDLVPCNGARDVARHVLARVSRTVEAELLTQ